MGKSSPGDVKAGGASVKINADSTDFSAALGVAEKRLKAFGKSAMAMGAKLGGIGLALGTGLLGAVKSFADTGSALEDMSQRTGDTASNLSAIGYAAKQSGTDLESLEGGLSKMSGTIAGAMSGEKAAAKLLNDLGLKAGDLKGKLPTEQLAIFADKIAGIADNDTKIDMVKSIFGKSGTELIPLLNEGSAGIEKLTKRAQELGIVMSDEDAAAASKLGDGLDSLYAAVGGVVTQIGGALAPAMSSIVDYMTNAAAAVSKFVGENKGLVIGVAMGAAALVAAGAAISGVGIAAYVAAGALKVLSTIVVLFSSPLTLAIAGLVALGAAFLAFTDQGRAMSASAAVFFGELLGSAQAAFAGIAAALQAGDIEGAAKLLWAMLGYVWEEGASALVNFTMQGLAEVADTILDAGVIIKKVWSDILVYLSGAFDIFSTGIMSGWKALTNKTASFFVPLMAKITGQSVEDIQASLDEMGQQDQANLAGGAQQRMKDRQGQLDKNLQTQVDGHAEIDKMRQKGKSDNFAAALGFDPAARKAELDALVAEINGKQSAAKSVGGDKLAKGAAGTAIASAAGSQMQSAAAQARGSAGAASTIAKAVNGSAGTPEKTLAAVNVLVKEMQKNNTLVEKGNKNPGIQIVERS